LNLIIAAKRKKDNKQYGAGGKWNFSVKVSISTTVNGFQQKTIRRRLKEVKIDKLKVVFIGDSR
jgi:hypothetical protein